MTGRAVNVKKGQFLAPEDMEYVVEKVNRSRPEGNEAPVYICERGSSFGYGRLINDFTGIPIMQKFAPVIFDATHSVQRPGGLGATSTGNRLHAIVLARCAAAADVDGLFCEVHDDPDNALSDGPNSLTIEMFEEVLPEVLAIRRLRQRAEHNRKALNEQELRKLIIAKKETVEKLI